MVKVLGSKTWLGGYLMLLESRDTRRVLAKLVSLMVEVEEMNL